MMRIYDLIAENYSAIFPPDENRVRFIKSMCPSGAARILDVGCATGDFAIDLAKAGYDVIGIDLNSRMIDIAKSKITDLQHKIEFQVMNMLDIDKLGIFNLILCFGNTLPHLQTEPEVNNFFFTANSSLPDSGAFIFQILNYDKILSDGKINFKIIETDSFIFRRNYHFPDNGLISFKIELEDKKTGRVYSDSTDLLPLRQKQLLALLEETGFKTTKVYSDYDMTKSDLQEYASIYVAQKSQALNRYNKNCYYCRR
jgi:glycine/sarcosine N-methyltransferase